MLSIEAYGMLFVRVYERLMQCYLWRPFECRFWEFNGLRNAVYEGQWNIFDDNHVNKTDGDDAGNDGPTTSAATITITTTSTITANTLTIATTNDHDDNYNDDNGNSQIANNRTRIITIIKYC